MRATVVVVSVAGVEPDPDAFRDRVQLAEDRVLVDRRPAELRDQERAEREVDLRLGPGDQPGEPGTDLPCGGRRAGRADRPSAGF